MSYFPLKHFLISDCKADILNAVGYNLTDDQVNAIDAILMGLDVVACMPTGSGKSLIFQALALSCRLRELENYVVIVVTPLKSISFTHRQSFTKVRTCYVVLINKQLS